MYMKKYFVVLGTNLHTHYVTTSVCRYSYLHIDISRIDVHEEIFYIFHYFIFTLIFKGICTYSDTNYYTRSTIMS